MPRLNKNALNVSQVNLMFVACVGDCEKVGAALNIDPEIVRKLAKDEGWYIQMERVCLLSKSGAPGDYERATNRALNWIQAHQTRELISRVLEKFRDMDEEEILEATSSVAKDGSRHVSGRFWADLTAAMEKTHSMSYAALGDTAGERAGKATDESESMNATALHMAVMSALNNPKIKGVEIVAEMAEAQGAEIKRLAQLEPAEPDKSPPSSAPTESPATPP